MGQFYPISPIVGITNTSYGAQAGVMDDMWAARVIRGKKIIAEKTMNDLNLDNMVGIIYGHARIEGLSRHAVAMCAGRLMQFARKYQEAGICPNYEMTDLVREGDETTESAGNLVQGDTPSAASSTTIAIESSMHHEFAKLGAVPPVHQSSGRDLWDGSAEARAIMLCEMATYGHQLPEGHLSAMMSNAAAEQIALWGKAGNSEILIDRFARLIQSCSYESQMPKTGTDRITIETGTCEMLRIAREIDPEANKLPPGFPCTYHEQVAERISEITGVTVSINTSSTGCIVTLHVE